MSRKKVEIIHLPDLKFIQLCNEEFGINRGIYNTIDIWLFNTGTTDILARRTKIYDFLKEHQETHYDERKGKVKFGTGNLSRLLKEYSEEKNSSSLFSITG